MAQRHLHRFSLTGCLAVEPGIRNLHRLAHWTAGIASDDSDASDRGVGDPDSVFISTYVSLAAAMDLRGNTGAIS